VGENELVSEVPRIQGIKLWVFLYEGLRLGSDIDKARKIKVTTLYFIYGKV
jgi:hypothetical protein